jgi:hypothetical protein
VLRYDKGFVEALETSAPYNSSSLAVRHDGFNGALRRVSFTSQVIEADAATLILN